jgi:tetratricopeptide (TPR) repeat protein
MRRPRALYLLALGAALAAAPALGEAPTSRSWAPMLEGATRFVEGHLDGADVAFAQAARGPARVPAELGRLLVALSRGDGAAATAAHARALAAGGDDPELHYWAAILELGRGRAAAALANLERAATLGGDRPAYLVARAVTLRALGRGAEAAAALATAAKADPDLCDPRLFPDPGRGVVLAVGRALRDYPDRHRLRGTLAQLYLKARLFREAEAEAGRLLVERRGDVDGLLVVGRARLAAGDAEGAREPLDRAAAAGPEVAAVHAARGEMFLALQRGADAERELERAVDLDPRDAVSLARLAARLWERGEAARAEVLWGYALRRDPRLAAAHYGLAQGHERQQRVGLAEAAFREAAALEPANPRFHEALAQFLERHGRARDAAVPRRRARAAASLQREFVHRQQRAVAVLQALERATARARAQDAAGAQEALKAPAIPPAARAFLLVYLAARQSPPVAGPIGRAVVGLPGPRDFVTGDLTLLQAAARIEGPGRVRLTTFLPGVNPERLR